MNMVLWLATGALLALAASFPAAALRRERLLVDVAAAGIGAWVGGAALVPATHWLSFETDWTGIAAAAGGAAVMLLATGLLARRHQHP
jgi:uncharacterized membrane protein YeaQ/YmgE (transglycosylase-associated protein family)